ncbi:MAG: hypothetical protein SFU25_06400, partial [Candidatus Caenarcaniphilales bacterium]|nr:hypothetical protein [Candidatus Caenarcaniphilales bacterium]
QKTTFNKPSTSPNHLSVQGNQDGKIYYKNFLPEKKLSTGSLESLVLAGQPQEHTLAVKPRQIIVFQSDFYTLNEALNEFTNKLRQLGFDRISVPINDYKRGGATVIQALNNQGRQIYVSFKTAKEMKRTGWRIEIY